MQRNTTLSVALLILVVALAIWSFARVVDRRFSSGEAYPRYSTLRSDPLGAKAFFEAVDRLEGVDAIRHFRPLDKLEEGRDTTLFLLHLTPEVFTDRRFNATPLLSFAAQGGRVVVTLDGQRDLRERFEKRVDERRKANAERARERDDKKAGGNADDSKDGIRERPSSDRNRDEAGEDGEKDEDDEALTLRRARSFQQVLGVTADPRNFTMTSAGALVLEKEAALPLNSGQLPGWYSRTGLKFEESEVMDGQEEEAPKAPRLRAGNWTVLARVGDSIMLAEQRIGQGSIVVATDSFFVSNEALFKEPAPAFLAWLVGPSSKVIFDEAHLGTVETPGIMTLARRLHLEGAFIGGLVLFGLFIWQSSSSLVPAQDQGSPAASVVSGHGATSGLVSLLRRGIPRRELLARCVAEWKKSHRQTGASASRLAAADEVMAALPSTRVGPRLAPDVYRRICDAVHAAPRSKGSR